MSITQVVPNLEKIKEIAESLLSSKILLCQPIRRGRNSRVYKIEKANGECFIGKFYYQNKNDSRDRLGVEYSSLQFLWQKGLQCIPQPLMSDPKNACAIYEYVDGKIFESGTITQKDMDQMLKFIDDLQKIKQDTPAGQFSNASEACFSIEDILTNIEHRRRRLDYVSHVQLTDFLQHDFDPFLIKLSEWVKEKAVEKGVAWQEVIALDKRTLSPSDLGFHNSLKTKDGKLVFCDFEYFGWDDPVKVASDFLLHPAMHLNDSLKVYFMKGMQRIFLNHEDLRVRLELSYPLFGMKWCLIFLNEFLSSDLSRRVFANHTIDEEKVLTEQLLKAKDMLTKIKNTYQENIYAK